MCNSLNKNSDSKKQLEEMGKNMAMPLPKLTEIDFFFFFFLLTRNARSIEYHEILRTKKIDVIIGYVW